MKKLSTKDLLSGVNGENNVRPVPIGSENSDEGKDDEGKRLLLNKDTSKR